MSMGSARRGPPGPNPAQSPLGVSGDFADATALMRYRGNILSRMAPSLMQRARGQRRELFGGGRYNGNTNT